LTILEVRALSVEKMDEATIEKLKAQKAFEDETAARLTPLYNSTKNTIIRLFVHRIILDTMKHSDLYQALIDLNDGVLVADVDKRRMSSELETHIREEAVMLKRAVEIGELIKDEKSRAMIEHIVDDEKRHHRILAELLEIIKIVEGMRKEDWLEFYYDRAEWMF